MALLLREYAHLTLRSAYSQRVGAGGGLNKNQAAAADERRGRVLADSQNRERRSRLSGRPLPDRNEADLTAWLEFHDSTLAAVNHTGKDVEVVLDAYIHCWDTLGDSWTGTGWMQPVRILIRDVGGRWAAPVLPIDISDGRLQVGKITHENMVRLPFNASDTINLWLQLKNADILEFIGHGVNIDAVGEARFVEDLTADLRPGDAG